jgi:hypothetical protein
LELEKEKIEKRIREKIEETLKQPETKQRLCGEGLSAEERARRIREIFRLPPEVERKNGLTPGTLSEIERAAKLL